MTDRKTSSYESLGRTIVEIARRAKGTSTASTTGVTTDTTSPAVIPQPLFDNPMEDIGDLIYGEESGAADRLAIGTEDQVLTVVDVGAGVLKPLWADPTGGSGSGAAIYFGSGAPSGGLGVDGDVYFDTDTGDVYQKASGTWALQDNLTGPAGINGVAAGTPLSYSSGDSAPPGSGFFTTEDHTDLASVTTIWISRLDTFANDITTWIEQWSMTDSTPLGTFVWTSLADYAQWMAFTVTAIVQFTDYYEVTVTFAGGVPNLSGPTDGVGLILITGDKGSDGSPGADGDPGADGSPGADGADGTDGADGSPGADGADGDDGIDGSTWYNGSGAPSGGLGIDGDYYLRLSNGDVYLKTSGSWSVVTNILGPTGATGATGPAGPNTISAAITFTEWGSPAAPGSANEVNEFAGDYNGFTELRGWNNGDANAYVLTRDSWIVGQNVGGSLSIGDPLYVIAASSNVLTLGKAKADALSTSRVLGVAMDAVANGQYVRVMRAGILPAYNTAIAAGDPVYLSATTAAAVQNAAPTTRSAYVVKLGTVITTGSSGVLEVEIDHARKKSEVDIVFNLKDGGVPTTGLYAVYHIPFGCTIVDWSLQSADGITGSITLDLKTSDYSGLTSYSSIIGAGTKPALSAATKAVMANLTSWTTAITAGTYLALNVDSASDLSFAVFTLTVSKDI